jgi:hypothetical protein
MPNHVTNILKFEGDEEQIKALKEKIKGEPFDDGTPCLIDFSNIIPFPKELNGTRSPAKIISQDEYNEWMKKYNAGEINDWERESKPLTQELSKELIKKYGANNWYDWKLTNWGTKWGAYSQSETDDELIVFQTAWSTAYPVMIKLSEMFPEVTITLEYADEDFGHNCGVIEFKDGCSEEIEGESYELANRILEQVYGENALECFTYQDEDCLDNDYSMFILGVMFDQFVEPDFSELKELSEAHLEAIINHVKSLEREDLKDYENKLHEVLDNKITSFTFPEGEIQQ